MFVVYSFLDMWKKSIGIESSYISNRGSICYRSGLRVLWEMYLKHSTYGMADSAEEFSCQCTIFANFHFASSFLYLSIAL